MHVMYRIKVNFFVSMCNGVSLIMGIIFYCSIGSIFGDPVLPLLSVSSLRWNRLVVWEFSC